MEILMQIPAIIKVLILFTGIVVIYKLKVPLWIALLFISLLAGLWFGASIEKTFQYALKSASSPDTLFLCAVIILIMGFSTMMDKTGVLKKIVGAFNDLLGKSMYSGAALPALIGLLPMPGGAVFSAPMVDAACGPGGKQTPEQKAAVNYWFRHIWEYWWPLYPGIILASSLFNISSGKLFILHVPLTVGAVLSGWFFILRPAFKQDASGECEADDKPKGSFISTIRESTSIIIVLAAIFAVGPILSATGVKGIQVKYWPVIVGMMLGILWLSISLKISVKNQIRYIFNKSMFSMVLMAVGVMMFRDILVDVNAFDYAQADLKAYHVPPIAVIAALPFISGFILGLAIGFVGASFPLVISLIPAAAIHTDHRFAYLTLAYSFAYAGMMLSPVHLCLVMTKDYFKAEFAGIYKWIIKPTTIIILMGLLLFSIYQKILN